MIDTFSTSNEQYAHYIYDIERDIDKKEWTEHVNARVQAIKVQQLYNKSDKK